MANRLPVEILNETNSVKLFNKWTYDDVEIKDISLQVQYF